jgi:hypothetical protein
MGKRARPEGTGTKATYRDVDVLQLKGALERARAALSAEDFALLSGAVDTFTALTRELQLKGATLERLRRLFLGSASEKTSKVLGDEEAGGHEEEEQPPGASTAEGTEKTTKRKGHGRNGAAAYTGAKREKVAHQELLSGGGCPGCAKGKV